MDLSKLKFPQSGHYNSKLSESSPSFSERYKNLVRSGYTCKSLEILREEI